MPKLINDHILLDANDSDYVTDGRRCNDSLAVWSEFQADNLGIEHVGDLLHFSAL